MEEYSVSHIQGSVRIDHETEADEAMSLLKAKSGKINLKGKIFNKVESKSCIKKQDSAFLSDNPRFSLSACLTSTIIGGGGTGKNFLNFSCKQKYSFFSVLGHAVDAS